MDSDESPRVMIETGAGELIDKITILRIKTERIADAAKLANIRRELDMLLGARACGLPVNAEINRLEEDLKRVNEALWDIEEEIRDCERKGEFGDRFVQLARSVYRHNDRRSALKRRINLMTGARIVEEKSYEP